MRGHNRQTLSAAKLLFLPNYWWQMFPQPSCGKEYVICYEYTFFPPFPVHHFNHQKICFWVCVKYVRNPLRCHAVPLAAESGVLQLIWALNSPTACTLWCVPAAVTRCERQPDAFHLEKFYVSPLPAASGPQLCPCVSWKESGSLVSSVSLCNDGHTMKSEGSADRITSLDGISSYKCTACPLIGLPNNAVGGNVSKWGWTLMRARIYMHGPLRACS